WYDWKNDGNDPAEREDNFGTVLANLEPKPAFRAIQTLCRQLAGYHVARRFPAQGEGDYLVLCQRRGRPEKLVAWTTGAPHEVSLPVRAHRKASITGITDGGPLVLPLPQGDHVSLHLTASPQYLTLENVSVRQP
ncbi:MAG TPA: hypothetical protein VHI52_15680, partial [Verrucomicrobiae bacterium]|nr:hypothetical protein [Verrucomicrobiae bacterium]